MSRKKAAGGTFKSGIGVLRGNRTFIQIASIGECDENGKAVFSVGFKGKLIAKADRPLATLAIPVLGELIHYAHYSTSEAVEADLAALRDFVVGLGEKPKPQPAEATAP